MHSSRGILITFEGTEGAGKSTLIQEVATRLREAGRSVTVTREPGGTPLAEKIRDVILEHEMNPWTELFLYTAARAEHLAVTIRPALDRGDVVLCDRFTDSSLAYQAHARGLPWKDVRDVNRIVTRKLKPALTVLLDIDPAAGLARATVTTRFENEGVAFQEKVRAGFAKARAETPSRWLIIRAQSGTPAELAAKVMRRLGRKLKLERQREAKARG